ncbi:MAG: hypothetical protein LC632_06020 [Xanthomonadaceae bacterium]|nr:hypothetical protein [Xanthomonadaceae bacterium]
MTLRTALAGSLLAVAAFLLPVQAAANGCIVVRAPSPHVIGLDSMHDGHPGRFEYTAGYRYLFSNRHFRGTHEEPERQANSTDVRNSVHTVDHTVTWYKSDLWRFSASLPQQFARRSSLYEHDRVNRHTMESNGIGDLRVVAYREFFPDNLMTHGLSIGLGFKVPTGSDDITDIAFTTTGPERRTVDQSIQPGDGGVGLIAEIIYYRSLSENEDTYAFFTGSYLINPKDTNGVQTFRSRASEAIMSVPDTYVVRTGVTRLLSRRLGMTGDLAIRAEGVPAEDLIGDSNGFRRPGYAVYIEPGLNLQKGAHRLSLNVPVTIHRNRVRSVTDRLDDRHGDAAFADSLFLMTYSARW